MSGLFEKDFIKRSIQQLAKLLAAVLLRRRDGEYEAALQTLHGGALELLGVEWRVLVAIDSRSAAELLQTPGRILAFARLRQEEAEVLEEQRDVLGAQSARAHALELYLEALLAGATLDADVLQAISALHRAVGAPADERYHPQLKALSGKLG